MNVNGETATSGAATGPIIPIVGGNTVTVAVAVEDGVTMETLHGGDGAGGPDGQRPAGLLGRSVVHRGGGCHGGRHGHGRRPGPRKRDLPADALAGRRSVPNRSCQRELTFRRASEYTTIVRTSSREVDASRTAFLASAAVAETDMQSAREIFDLGWLQDDLNFVEAESKWLLLLIVRNDPRNDRKACQSLSVSYLRKYALRSDPQADRRARRPRMVEFAVGCFAARNRKLAASGISLLGRQRVYRMPAQFIGEHRIRRRRFARIADLQELI